MGISIRSAQLLTEAVVESRITGNVLTLGVQDCFFKPQELNALLKRYGIAAPEDVLLSEKPTLRAAGFISPEMLFRALGFAEYHTLDASDYEGCDLVFDLNSGQLPPELVGQFDFIFDGGTIEHVFHIPNALHNLGHMLKVGGVIYHASPTNNFIDHGFYTFSPTFFLDFYSENKWEIVDLYLQSNHRENLYGGSYYLYDYHPERLVELSMGGLDDQMYHTFCIARKKEISTTNRIPQQGDYQKFNWQNKPRTDAPVRGQYKLVVRREV